MKNSKYYTFLFALLIPILFSCNSYQKLLKSDNVQLKYEKAKEYFNDKRYDRALLLIEDILPYFKATTEAERINYYYAYCQLAVGNNLLAAFRFKTLYDTYPLGEFAEEALYNHAYCYYLVSPPIELDQSFSQKAIDALQLFINRFPQSEKVEQCNTYMDELLYKLEQKDIRTAKLYYKIEEYKAAIWALTDVLHKYPLTPEKKDLQFLVLDSYFKLAQHSVESKKQERINDIIDYYISNKDVFETTRYAAEAENIYKNALNQIRKYN